MKDFSWKYFALTGDVESYLLYKEIYKKDVSLQTDSVTVGEAEDDILIDEGTT